MYQQKNNLNQEQNNKIEFAGYASVFNVIDKQKDVIEKNAFVNVIKNFANNNIQLLFEHNQDQQVGTITLLQEDDYGLYVEGIIDENLPDSAELITKIKNNKNLNFSIGYYTLQSEKKGNINYINEVDLIEISFVKKPANPDAKILNVDGIYTDYKISQMINDVKNKLLFNAIKR